MVEKQDENTIIVRRKMAVFGNKQITIPVDVIEFWGNKVPKNVYFTIKRANGSVVVLIEPDEQKSGGPCPGCGSSNVEEGFCNDDLFWFCRACGKQWERQ